MFISLLNSRIIKYLTISCFVTVLDFVVTMVLFHYEIGLVTANIIGMVTGSITQYFLLYRFLYDKPYGFHEFIKFESTFILGLGISTVIIGASYHVFHVTEEMSKVISIILTFLVLYFIRENILGTVPSHDTETV